MPERRAVGFVALVVDAAHGDRPSRALSEARDLVGHFLQAQLQPLLDGREIGNFIGSSSLMRGQ
jgi:hypothetical protein